MCEEICTDDLKQLFEKIFVAGFTVFFRGIVVFTFLKYAGFDELTVPKIITISMAQCMLRYSEP
jgi:hypothetical protein